jgi:hypothetical protein
VASEGAHFLSCGHLPQLDRVVIGAGGEELPVGAERHGIDPVGVAFEGAHFSSCGHLPELDRLVIGAGGEELPVGAERHGPDQVGVALRVRTSCPVATSHSLIVPSPEPEARSRPSGLNATDLTQPVWPSRVRTSLPVATSHSLIVLSSEPEARSFPSGLNATELTP